MLTSGFAFCHPRNAVENRTLDLVLRDTMPYSLSRQNGNIKQAKSAEMPNAGIERNCLDCVVKIAGVSRK